MPLIECCAIITDVKERDRAADDVTAWKEKLAAQELANQEKEVCNPV